MGVYCLGMTSRTVSVIVIAGPNSSTWGCDLVRELESFDVAGLVFLGDKIRLTIRRAARLAGHNAPPRALPYFTTLRCCVGCSRVRGGRLRALAVS